MDNTPLTAQTLLKIINEAGRERSALATDAELSPAYVTYHLGGSRPVRDVHLAKYMAVLDISDKRRLFAAWMKDVLDPESLEALFGGGENRLAEEVVEYASTVEPETVRMMKFWIDRFRVDSELKELFETITKRAGYVPGA